MGLCIVSLQAQVSAECARC